MNTCNLLYLLQVVISNDDMIAIAAAAADDDDDINAAAMVGSLSLEIESVLMWACFIYVMFHLGGVLNNNTNRSFVAAGANVQT